MVVFTPTLPPPPTHFRLQQRDALEDAQAEIQKLRADRERYGESVKTAFMRGVCALNMEAMSMFHPAAEGLPEPPVAAGTAAHHLHHHHHQHGETHIHTQTVFTTTMNTELPTPSQSATPEL